jgi:hypothetical protein
VFNQPIRTNNDAEGWHNRINCHTKDKMNFYALVPELHKESKLIPLYKKLMCQLFDLWESYPEKLDGKHQTTAESCV